MKEIFNLAIMSKPVTLNAIYQLFVSTEDNDVPCDITKFKDELNYLIDVYLTDEYAVFKLDPTLVFQLGNLLDELSSTFTNTIHGNSHFSIHQIKVLADGLTCYCNYSVSTINIINKG